MFPVIAGMALGSAALGSLGALGASSAQKKAAEAATAEQRRQYDTTRSDLAPYRNVGSLAINRVGDLLGLRSSDQDIMGMITSGGLGKHGDTAAESVANFKRWAPTFLTGKNLAGEALNQNQMQTVADVMAAINRQGSGASSEDIMAMDPGYQFRLNEGLKSGRNIAGARGMLNSGATGKALTRYGQDYASNEFGNVYNRLMGAAGQGQNATNTTVAAGTNMANNVGNTMMGAANARGAAGIAGANAWGNAFDTIGNWWSQNQTLDKILNRGGIAGGGNPGMYSIS